MKETGEGRLAPEVVEMRDPSHDEHEVDGAVTHHLIRDVHIAALRVMGRRDLPIGNADGAPVDGGRLDQRSIGGRAGHDFHRRDEPISSPMSGLDVFGMLRVVAQGASNLAHAHLQRRVSDENTRPNPIHELVLRDEPAGVLREIFEDAERAWRQRDGRGPTEKAGVATIQGKLTEHERGRR